MGLLGRLRGRLHSSYLRSQEAYLSMRCLDSRPSANGRMPRPRKALRTIKIDPKLIREARELVGACNEEGSQADALTLLLADATPSKPCNNLNYHEWHLPEDCHLPAVCTVYGDNNHTACHCRMVCARCGAADHNRMRCVAEKDTFGAPLSPLVRAHRRLTRQPDGCLIILFCIVILRPGHSTPRDRRKSAPMRNSGVEVRQVMPCEGEIRKGADYLVSKLWLMCTDPVN